jgi:hypothetical protein
VVDDFSSKLDLPRALETIESIDADHMQMVRYSSRGDEGYRAIFSIFKGYISNELEIQTTLEAEARNASRTLRKKPYSTHGALTAWQSFLESLFDCEENLSTKVTIVS